MCARGKTVIPVISDNPRIQSFYEQCRREGASHSLAEIFAFKQGPGLVTDAHFFEGTGTLLDQFEGDERGLNIVLEGARKHGYTPNINDRYEPGLCHPDLGAGDPAAFIPPTSGRDHIRKVCEKRGWSSRGAVEIDAPKGDTTPEPIGENIVSTAVKHLAKDDPKILKASKAEQRQEAISKFAPKW